MFERRPPSSIFLFVVQLKSHFITIFKGLSAAGYAVVVIGRREARAGDVYDGWVLDKSARFRQFLSLPPPPSIRNHYKLCRMERFSVLLPGGFLISSFRIRVLHVRNNSNFLYVLNH